MNKLLIIIFVGLASGTVRGMGESSLPYSRLDQQVMDAQLARRLERELIDTRFPLHVAIRSDNASALSMLLQKAETRSIIDAPHPKLTGFPTALHEACLRGAANMVQLLLNEGANIEARTKPKRATPLNVCYMSVANETIAALLLRYGADVNTRDANGDTPLHGACKVGAVGMVALLLRYGAQQQYNNLHQLPGEYAADNSAIQRILKCSIKKSANIKIPLGRKAVNKQHDDDESDDKF